MKTRGAETVRGCEKRIYYVKNTGSEIFEEAYLVLRRQERGVSPAPVRFDSGELEREAGRIVSSVAGEGDYKMRRGSKDKLKAFVAGAATSAIFTSLVVLGLYFLIVS